MATEALTGAIGERGVLSEEALVAGLAKLDARIDEVKVRALAFLLMEV